LRTYTWLTSQKPTSRVCLDALSYARSPPKASRLHFAATGVYPFNPAAIAEKMTASLPTSTKSTFPLQQSSPVRAVIAAMGSHAATTLQLSPTAFTAPVAGPSRVVDLDLPINSPSPTRRRGQDPDDGVDTPTKRMRIFYSALESTSSGSMLVGKTRITSAYEVAAPVLEDMPELPEPDWELLQDMSDIVGYQSRSHLSPKSNSSPNAFTAHRSLSALMRSSRSA